MAPAPLCGKIPEKGPIGTGSVPVRVPQALCPSDLRPHARRPVPSTCSHPDPSQLWGWLERRRRTRTHVLQGQAGHSPHPYGHTWFPYPRSEATSRCSEGHGDARGTQNDRAGGSRGEPGGASSCRGRGVFGPPSAQHTGGRRRRKRWVRVQGRGGVDISLRKTSEPTAPEHRWRRRPLSQSKRMGGKVQVFSLMCLKSLPKGRALLTW